MHTDEGISVLTLTNDAVAAIRTLTTEEDLPAQTGLRIAATTERDGSASLALAVSPGPEPGDQLVESEGARVYLDSGAAAVLDDKALDAEMTSEGQVRFQLAEQPE